MAGGEWGDDRGFVDGVGLSHYSQVRNPQLKRHNFGFAQLLEATVLNA